MLIFWSIGLTLDPTIRGTSGAPLRNPSRLLPLFLHEASIFSIYPYTLPIFICASTLSTTVIVVPGFLEETHPDMRRRQKPGGNNASAAGSGLRDSEAEPLLSTSINNSNHTFYRSFPISSVNIASTGPSWMCQCFSSPCSSTKLIRSPSNSSFPYYIEPRTIVTFHSIIGVA